MQRTLLAAAAAAMILLGGASAAAATGANLTGAESEPAAAATLGAGGPVDPAPAAASGPPGPARTGQREKYISDHARNTIWAEYPAMQGAIDLINRGAFAGLIDYAIYPTQEYSDPRGIPTSVRKIPKRNMDTPQYWLLLKIYRGRTYNIIADHIGDPWRGVPPAHGSPPSSGEGYFARGLRDNNPDSEADLLRALYIGATGSAAGAEPILNGSYKSVQSVQDTVREWQEQGRIRSRLTAYNWNILKDTDFVDNELVELSLLMLGEYYRDDWDLEKRDLYMGTLIRSLTKLGKLPGYSVWIAGEGGNVTIGSPLPRIRFRSR